MTLRGFAATLAALAVITSGASGCSEAGASNEENPETAVTVEEAGEDQPARLTVSERAEQRLGLRTEPVRPLTGHPGVTEVISYSAVVYDSDGASWAFSAPSPRTYVRVPIEISSITGKTVQLKSGPPVGTQVVVVGAPELVGAEAGISGEE
ncbi:MAG TPA: hypothetical protein VNC63_14005 [Propionibacteriaceae bacterium]|jgi:hypothetical protein|nr:hypothetical protein [Propionibacteriaceae bacterium]